MSGLGSEAAVIIGLVFSAQYQLCPAGTLMTWRREKKKILIFKWCVLEAGVSRWKGTLLLLRD